MARRSGLNSDPPGAPGRTLHPPPEGRVGQEPFDGPGHLLVEVDDPCRAAAPGSSGPPVEIRHIGHLTLDRVRAGQSEPHRLSARSRARVGLGPLGKRDRPPRAGAHPTPRSSTSAAQPQSNAFRVRMRTSPTSANRSLISLAARTLYATRATASGGDPPRRSSRAVRSAPWSCPTPGAMIRAPRPAPPRLELVAANGTPTGSFGPRATSIRARARSGGPRPCRDAAQRGVECRRHRPGRRRPDDVGSVSGVRRTAPRVRATSAQRHVASWAPARASTELAQIPWCNRSPTRSDRRHSHGWLSVTNLGRRTSGRRARGQGRAR